MLLAGWPVTLGSVRCSPRLAVFALLAAACQAYEPGAFAVDEAGLPDVHARRLDCLDVRVETLSDPAVPASWPVVGIDIGNRCRDAVHVDLRHVRVTARYADGLSQRVRAFDPRRELRAAVLDSRARAREVIAYVAPDSAYDAPSAICVDVAGITRAEPVAPICFERDDT